MLTQAHRNGQWCALIANGDGNARVLAHTTGDDHDAMIRGVCICIMIGLHGDHALKICSRSADSRGDWKNASALSGVTESMPLCGHHSAKNRGSERTSGRARSMARPTPD